MACIQVCLVDKMSQSNLFALTTNCHSFFLQTSHVERVYACSTNCQFIYNVYIISGHNIYYFKIICMIFKKHFLRSIWDSNVVKTKLCRLMATTLSLVWYLSRYTNSALFYAHIYYYYFSSIIYYSHIFPVLRAHHGNDATLLAGLVGKSFTRLF